MKNLLVEFDSPNWNVNPSVIVDFQLIALEDLLGLSHGALDVKRTDVLPVLLQQRHKKVNSESDVADEVIVGHGDITDGNS